MKRFILTLLVLAVSCGSSFAGGDQSPGELCKKNTDDNVYYVTARRYRTAQQETNECLFRAARQISIRKGAVIVYSETPEKDAKGKTRIKTSSSIDFNQSDTFDLADRMKVLTTERRDASVAMQIRLTGAPAFKNLSIPASNAPGLGGNPGWVANPPKGKGYYAAVGSVPGTEGPGDSFMSADTAAICALAKFSGQPNVSGNTKTWKATIQGAYIARRWYNSKENRFYSLAIVPR